MQLSSIVGRLGANYKSVQAELQRKGKGDIIRIGRGLYTTPDIANKKGLVSISKDVEPHTSGQSFVRVRHAQTGKLWFTIDYVSDGPMGYFTMRLHTPADIVATADADVEIAGPLEMEGTIRQPVKESI